MGTGIDANDNTVLVHAKGVANRTQVRFGWENTANLNLMNKEGLPPPAEHGQVIHDKQDAG